MSVSSLTLRAAIAAALLTPALPAQAAPPCCTVAVKVSIATFTGRAKILKGRPGRPTSITAYSTDCRVAGIHVPTSFPFLVSCDFRFSTGPAPLSTACTGAWRHISTLTFTEPVTWQQVIINYDPTATSVVEGDGGGAGTNPLRFSKVKYAIDSLCTLTGESDEVDANLTGSASGPV